MIGSRGAGHSSGQVHAERNGLAVARARACQAARRAAVLAAVRDDVHEEAAVALSA
jgi:hypothetical protein